MVWSAHPLLRSVGAARADSGAWTVDVSPAWASWSGPLGGVLQAVATHAALDAAGGGAGPYTTHLQFVRRFSTSPITFSPTVERAGSSTAFVSVRGTQDGATCCIGSVVCGPPDGRGQRQHVVAPAVPDPADCGEVRFPTELVPFGAQFEFRQACGAYPMSGVDRPEMGAWIRLRPDVAVDHLVAVVMLDAMPPGLYATLTEPVAVVSAELSMHLHADLANHPVEDHVLAIQHTVTDGVGSCVDEAALWDRDGRLLAQSRQLRRIRRLTGSPGS